MGQALLKYSLWGCEVRCRAPLMRYLFRPPSATCARADAGGEVGVGLKSDRLWGRNVVARPRIGGLHGQWELSRGGVELGDGENERRRWGAPGTAGKSTLGIHCEWKESRSRLDSSRTEESGSPGRARQRRLLPPRAVSQLSLVSVAISASLSAFYLCLSVSLSLCLSFSPSLSLLSLSLSVSLSLARALWLSPFLSLARVPHPSSDPRYAPNACRVLCALKCATAQPAVGRHPQAKLLSIKAIQDAKPMRRLPTS
eukprot:6073666-Pleurochrysis_carterae.AAC.1